jgi:PadR family transcriptional regulator PadR
MMMFLTRKEELILLSILNLRDDAYLIAIQDYLGEATGKPCSLTSVYMPLNRLEKRGLIESRWGAAAEIRGGRRKRIYDLTKIGWEALDWNRKLSEKLWADYRKLAPR